MTSSERGHRTWRARTAKHSLEPSGSAAMGAMGAMGAILTVLPPPWQRRNAHACAGVRALRRPITSPRSTQWTVRLPHCGRAGSVPGGDPDSVRGWPVLDDPVLVDAARPRAAAARDSPSGRCRPPVRASGCGCSTSRTGHRSRAPPGTRRSRPTCTSDAPCPRTSRPTLRGPTRSVGSSRTPSTLTIRRPAPSRPTSSSPGGSSSRQPMRSRRAPQRADGSSCSPTSPAWARRSPRSSGRRRWATSAARDGCSSWPTGPPRSRSATGAARSRRSGTAVWSGS